MYLDDRQRIAFFSNYDGSLESYMDDFINKVGFGLNVVFSNGIGYPRTNWLVLDGCADERNFKEYLRRHQLPTQVWYKAYPGLTAADLERNARIRRGLESSSMSDREIREWVALYDASRRGLLGHSGPGALRLRAPRSGFVRPGSGSGMSAAARAWLSTAPVTTAVTMQPPPTSAMQVAFTAAGLRALGVATPVLAAFAPEFLSGMSEPSRSRRLGDTGANAPSGWAWGGPTGVPHLVVMFFAAAGKLEALVHETTGGAWKQAFEPLHWLGTADLDGPSSPSASPTGSASRRSTGTSNATRAGRR